MLISKDQKLPPMLVSAALLDDRVPAWIPAKFVAKQRLYQSQVPSHNEESLMLLKTSFDGGHYGSSNGDGNALASVEELAFMFQALKLPLQ